MPASQGRSRAGRLSRTRNIRRNRHGLGPSGPPSGHAHRASDASKQGQCEGVLVSAATAKTHADPAGTVASSLMGTVVNVALLAEVLSRQIPSRGRRLGLGHDAVAPPTVPEDRSRGVEPATPHRAAPSATWAVHGPGDRWSSLNAAASFGAQSGPDGLTEPPFEVAATDRTQRLDAAKSANPATEKDIDRY